VVRRTRDPDIGSGCVQRLLPFATPPGWSNVEFGRELTACLGRPVRVVYGRARQTPVQVQPDTEVLLHVRLHEFFAAAPMSVVADLGRWIAAGRRARKASTRLDTWIADRLEELPAPAARHAPLRATGRCYDLQRLRDAVILDHVPELAATPPAVTWGRRSRSRGVHSLDLGTFDLDSRIVRLHPVLDHPAVPEFFVRFVLFHELLHTALPWDTTESRPRHHPPEFRARERRHPDYRQAEAWEADNLPSLLARARRGCDG
jgi:hypothetical protein